MLAALDDAGIAAAEVDGIVRCDMDLVRHNDLAEALGIRQLSYWGECGPGGVAPCAMIGQAVGAILSGQADHGRGLPLAERAVGPAVRRRARVGGASRSSAAARPTTSSSCRTGCSRPGQMFALMAQRHMIEYGSTPEQLGSIAIACRDRAQANPAAQMHGRPLTMDDYLSARMISSPLRLYDYCLETDGAAAVVVTSAERARDCRNGAALIQAVAQASLPGTQPGTMFPVLMRDSITSLSSRAVAELLWARSGLGPADVDVAQLYDCFTITLLLQLEDYGFAKRGEGGAFAADGGIGLDGPLPVQHLGRSPVRGLHPRHEPHRRGGPPDPRHVLGAGARGRGQPGHVRAAAREQRADPDGGPMTTARPDSQPAARLAPAVSDPDTGGFFAAAARGEVALRYCAGCGAVLHLPRAYCWHCGGWDTGYRAVPPRARVYSWTVVEHQVHPAYPVPYTVALVELAGEPAARLVTYLPGRPALHAWPGTQRLLRAAGERHGAGPMAASRRGRRGE